MILKEDLVIDGLHYILKFDHYSFSFSLNKPPRAYSFQAFGLKQVCGSGSLRRCHMIVTMNTPC